MDMLLTAAVLTMQGNKKRRLDGKEHMDIVDEFCAAVQVGRAVLQPHALCMCCICLPCMSYCGP